MDDAFASRTAQVLGCPVYPNFDPQNQAIFPVVTYYLISQPTLQGLSQRIRSEVPRYQVNVIGTSYKQVEALIEKVITSWQGFSGVIDGYKIWGCEVVSESYQIEVDQTPNRTLFFTHVDMVFQLDTSS